MNAVDVVAIAESAVADRDRLITLVPSDPRWLRLVESAAEATTFHQPAWLHVLTRTYGLHGLVLGLIDAQGEVAAGLPLVRVRRPLSGPTYVSLPFTDHCPPLSREGYPLPPLASALDAWRRQGKAEVEVRGELPEESGLTAETVAVRHLLPLDDRCAELRQLKPPVARNVRAAGRAGVQVRLGKAREDMRTFYRLHVQTRRRLGVPVQPRRFLDAVWEHLIDPGMGFVAIAEAPTGEPVAAALFLAHGQSLIYKYGASDASRWELKPNHLLFWTAINWGRENGHRVLDFGRSDIGSDGLRRFKAGWGALEVPLSYTTSRRSGPGGARSERMAAALGPLIRRSPSMVCRGLGELLYRYAG